VSVEHDSTCEGAHTADITCVEVARLRAAAAADPWYCPRGRNGYHLFDNATGLDPGQRCQYGCGRVQGELRADHHRADHDR
jgi:hypothetical protein